MPLILYQPRFVSGGFLNATSSSRGRVGTKLDGLVALADWYSTFAFLAGIVDPTDHAAAAAGLPPIDSLNLWPYLSGAARPAQNPSNPF